jgi:hypothetical protein
METDEKQAEYFEEIQQQHLLNSAEWMEKRTAQDRGLRHCRFAGQGKLLSTRSCMYLFRCYQCEFFQAIEDKAFYKKLAAQKAAKN